MDKKLNKNIAMVAYTYYSTDPRVKKEAEALVESGFNVDFFSLRNFTLFELIHFIEDAYL